MVCRYNLLQFFDDGTRLPAASHRLLLRIRRGVTHLSGRMGAPADARARTHSRGSQYRVGCLHGRARSGSLGRGPGTGRTRITPHDLRGAGAVHRGHRRRIAPTSRRLRSAAGVGLRGRDGADIVRNRSNRRKRSAPRHSRGGDGRDLSARGRMAVSTRARRRARPARHRQCGRGALCRELGGSGGGCRGSRLLVDRVLRSAGRNVGGRHAKRRGRIGRAVDRSA